jgi:hypothetical protein
MSLNAEVKFKTKVAELQLKDSNGVRFLGKIANYNNRIMGNDHLTEIYLIKIVFFQLIETFIIS